MSTPVYLPFGPGPYRARMGLRPLDDGRWVEFGHLAAEQLLHKRRLITAHPDGVTAVIDDPDGLVRTASAELRDVLSSYLLGWFPDRFRRRSTVPGDGLEVVEVGPVDFRDGRHPVEHAGLLAPTDWCVHLPDDRGDWRLVAASVCFPTRWVLSSKIGLTVGEVHAPVSAYDGALSGAVDRFLDRLRPERPMWRLNWNLVDRPELYQPTAGPPPDPPITAADAGDRVYLRVERQTFVRLPATGAVVFGIEVHVDPLRSIAAVPGAPARLLSAVEAIPEATRAEKGLDRMLDPVLAWLRSAPPTRTPRN